MPSQRIVRCEITRGTDTRLSVRYIPMEIFGLWEYLMTTKHGFAVRSRQASLWIDAEESPDIRSSESRFDEVTEVTLFVYSNDEGMFSRVMRYFPTEEYSELRDIFLRHYAARAGDGQLEPQIKERPGVWIRRTDVHV